MRDADWVDRDLWPWTPRFVEAEGGRLHYIDEGPEEKGGAGEQGGREGGRLQGPRSREARDGFEPERPTLLLIHGTPTWSFLYRHLIADLSRDYRVVAFDHLGFGLSDRPRDWGYRPQDHARNVARLTDALALDRVVVMVHDFGGPIGLSWVLDHLERVAGVALFNTWMWSLQGTSAGRMSRLLGGRVGRFLYRRNFSARVLLPMGYADRESLSSRVHRQYLDAFPDADARHAPWVLARELLASADWYERLWSRRRLLSGLPVLLLWGMKDPAFGAAALSRWEEALPSASIHRLEDVGHFVQEEAPAASIEAARTWLAASVEEKLRS